MRRTSKLSAAVDLCFTLHDQVLLVLFLEFLNSFRNFGLRFMQYNYFVDEFGLSDVEAGSLLGTSAAMHVIFGFVGSLATDTFGVRSVAIFALGVALIARGLLVVGRSRFILYTAKLVLSPIGDSMLSNGLYYVALKKMTTPLNRGLAFSLSYASFNFAGAIGTQLIDTLKGAADVTIFGSVFTGARIFLAITWLAILLTLILVIGCLKDVTIVERSTFDDPDLQVALPPSTATSTSDSAAASSAPTADAHLPTAASLPAADTSRDVSPTSAPTAGDSTHSGASTCSGASLSSGGSSLSVTHPLQVQGGHRGGGGGGGGRGGVHVGAVRHLPKVAEATDERGGAAGGLAVRAERGRGVRVV